MILPSFFQSLPDSTTNWTFLVKDRESCLDVTVCSQVANSVGTSRESPATVASPLLWDTGMSLLQWTPRMVMFPTGRHPALFSAVVRGRDLLLPCSG